MLISHKHKLIVYSLPKTGSESVRAWLAPLSEVPIATFQTRTRRHPFYAHMPPADVQAEFKARSWKFDAYAGLTVVRNPFARLVSLFEMILTKDRIARVRAGVGAPFRFERWIAQISTNGRGGGGWRHQTWRRFGTYSIGNWIVGPSGRPLVNHIVRLEHLAVDLPAVLSRLGIPLMGSLPHRNVGRTQTYRDRYTDCSREIVERLFHKDLSDFRYSFAGDHTLQPQITPGLYPFFRGGPHDQSEQVNDSMNSAGQGKNRYASKTADCGSHL